ncbi:Protein of unknown function [Georgenia satyanarayanai]|uniref:DUF2530 domain-containing protein n=1 Tax=Georgenia satyanarayanai TaxID=860221 RepID=A0A2Y9BWK6_9MICO|nr:DUF2530 domain-containing protein [Georgenia satyanarayanai]PYG00993.1 uncharacterized protein DUF2530 [Georgenia satyanarayanai]SSA39232.1 Protein of unknown function [Georgenia satyanarayanai]
MRIPETRSQDLPPMRVNTVTMFLAGTIAWAVGLVVVLVLEATGRHLDGVVAICLTGIAVGLLGMLWGVAQQRRAARRGR